MDAVSGLWLPGGSVFTKAQLSKMVSAAFTTIGGIVAPGRLMHRSRALTHIVCGPGPHRTFAPACIVVAWLQQWVRMRVSGRISSDGWVDLWNHRRAAPSGFFNQLSIALRW